MTIVVKIGGAAGNSSDPVLDELARRADSVLVHGGSDAVDRLGTALGRPPEAFTSPSGVTSRRTRAADLEVLVLAMAGEVQTGLVAALTARGGRAAGLSGVDGPTLIARRKQGVRAVRDGRVIHLADDFGGSIERVDDRLLRALLGAGFLPVLGPPAISPTGEIVSVDADRAAAATATALHAEALVLLTNVPGLLRDPGDLASRLPRVGRDGIDEVLPLAAGRMRKKVLAAREALEGGVPRVVIAPSGVSAPVARALAGEGTVFE